jgi:O-antigen/teichoic acid export membrane protein
VDSEATIADGVSSNGEATSTPRRTGRSLLARVVKSHPTSMTRRAMQGSIWTLAGYTGAQALRFCSNLVLAWLLNPAAFGLMRTTYGWMTGLQMFSDIGVAPAIIQHRRALNPNFYNTAWTMQVIRGCVLAVVGCAIAVPLSWLYNEPELASIFMVASSTAFLAGFSSTKVYLESRELRVPRVIALDVAAQLAAVTVMIPLAMQWKSAWPLVIGGVVSAATRVVLTQFALPGPVNHLHWDRESARDLHHFGRWIFVSTMFTFLGMQIDSLILPLLISFERFGVYSIGVSVVGVVLGIFEQLTNRILMPAMAHWSRSSEHQFRQVVLDSRRFILSAAAIAVGNLILLAPALFRWLYDVRYVEAGRITQLMCIGLWFSLLQRTSQASLLAAGASRAMAAANATNSIVTLTLAPLGYFVLGLEGFIGGWTLGNLTGLIVVNFALSRRGIVLFWQDIKLTLGVIAFASAGFLLHLGHKELVLQIIVPWMIETLPLSTVEFVGRNIWPLLIEIVPAGLITVVAAAIVWFSYPRSMSLRERIFGADIATADDEKASDMATAILSSSEGGAFGGKD